MYLWPVSPVSKPRQAVNSSGTWPVLKTNPAFVATLCQLLQDVLVIELSCAVRLITVRNLQRSHPGNHQCSVYVRLHTNSRTSLMAYSFTVSSQPQILDFNEARDDGMAVSSAGSYANHFHLASNR